MALTILDILEQSGLDWRETPGQPNEVKVCCPFCIENGETPDTRYRLGINIADGRANCFNCHWTSDNYVYTARSIAAIADVDIRGDRVIPTQKPADAYKPKSAPAPVLLKGLPDGYEPFLFEPDDEFEAQPLRYLMGRGITRQQIERWEIGWALCGEYGGRVIIPVHHDRVLVGVVGRDFTGQSTLRYKNSESLRGVFGMKGSEHAVMSEGAMDALRIEPLFPNDDSIAVFGSNISAEQMNLLKRYRSITYLGDYDAPGCKGARVNCEQMDEAGIEVRVSIPSKLDGSDPGSQSNELLMLRRRTSVPWSRHAERLLRMREAFQ